MRSYTTDMGLSRVGTLEVPLCVTGCDAFCGQPCVNPLPGSNPVMTLRSSRATELSVSRIVRYMARSKNCSSVLICGRRREKHEIYWYGNDPVVPDDPLENPTSLLPF